MKLHSIKIVAAERGRVRLYVVGCGDGLGTQRHVIAVNKIHIVTLIHATEQRRLQVDYRVPPHLRHLVLMALRLEAHHIGIKHSDAVNIAFLGMAAQQLLSYADA